MVEWKPALDTYQWSVIFTLFLSLLLSQISISLPTKHLPLSLCTCSRPPSLLELVLSFPPHSLLRSFSFEISGQCHTAVIVWFLPCVAITLHLLFCTLILRGSTEVHWSSSAIFHMVLPCNFEDFLKIVVIRLVNKLVISCQVLSLSYSVTL